MASQEQESQIVPPPDDHLQFQPPRAIFDGQNSNFLPDKHDGVGHSRKVLSDESKPEDCHPAIDKDGSIQDNLSSLVNDTQYVEVERDTQATDRYDLSPTTRRVIESTASSPAAQPSHVIQEQFLAKLSRPSIEDHQNSFSWKKAPKFQHLNFARPPPGNVSLSRESKIVQPDTSAALNAGMVEATQGMQ